MMKGYKSALVLFVAMLLMFSMAPFQAFAEEIEIDLSDLDGVVDVVTDEMDDQGQIDSGTNDESSEGTEATNVEEGTTIDIDNGEEVNPEDQVDQDLNDVEGTKELVEELDETKDQEQDQTDERGRMLMNSRSTSSYLDVIFLNPLASDDNSIEVIKELNINDFFESYVNNNWTSVENIAVSDFLQNDGAFARELKNKLPLFFAELFISSAERKTPQFDQWRLNIDQYPEDNGNYKAKNILANELVNTDLNCNETKTKDEGGEDIIDKKPAFQILNWNLDFIGLNRETTISDLFEGEDSKKLKSDESIAVYLQLSYENLPADCYHGALYIYDDNQFEKSGPKTPFDFKFDALFDRYRLYQSRKENAEKYSEFNEKTLLISKDDPAKKLDNFVRIAKPEQQYYDVKFMLSKFEKDIWSGVKDEIKDETDNLIASKKYFAARGKVAFTENHVGAQYKSWNLIKNYLEQRKFFIFDKLSDVIEKGHITPENDKLPEHTNSGFLIDNQTKFVKPEVDGDKQKSFMTYEDLRQDDEVIFKNLHLEFLPYETFVVHLSFKDAKMEGAGENDYFDIVLNSSQVGYKLSQYKPVKEGYRFIGWTKKDGTPDQANPDFEITETKDQTVVAHFEKTINSFVVEFRVPIDKAKAILTDVKGGNLTTNLADGSDRIYQYKFVENTVSEIKTEMQTWVLPTVEFDEENMNFNGWIGQKEDKTEVKITRTDSDALRTFLTKDITIIDGKVVTLKATITPKAVLLDNFKIVFESTPFILTTGFEKEKLNANTVTVEKTFTPSTIEAQKSIPEITDKTVTTDSASYTHTDRWILEGSDPVVEIKDATSMIESIKGDPRKEVYKFIPVYTTKIRISVGVEIPSAYNTEKIALQLFDKNGKKTKEYLTENGKLSFGITGESENPTWAEMFKYIELQHHEAANSKNVLVGFDPNFESYKSGERKDGTAQDITFTPIFVPKDPSYDGSNRDNLLRNILAGIEYKKSEQYKKLPPEKREAFDEGLVHMAKVYNASSALTDEQYNEAIKDIDKLGKENPNTDLAQILKIIAGQNKLIDPATGVSIEWVQLQPNDKLVVKPIATDVLNNTGKVDAAVLYDIYIERNNKKLILENLSQQIKVGIPVPERCRETTLGFPKFKDNYTVYYVEVNAENKPTQLRAISPVQIEADNKAYFLTNHLSYWAIAKPLATGGADAKVDAATSPNQTTKIPATGEAGTPLFIAIAVLSLGIVLTVLRKRMK